MAKQTINTLRAWFRTGLKPTELHFWSIFDSFFHKDDKVPLASIDGIQGEFDKKRNISTALAMNDVTGLTDVLNSLKEKQGAFRSEVIATPTLGTEIITLKNFHETYFNGLSTSAFTVALAAEISGLANEYAMVLNTGATVPTISWPQGVIWLPDTIEIEANSSYILLFKRVYNGIGYITYGLFL